MQMEQALPLGQILSLSLALTGLLFTLPLALVKPLEPPQEAPPPVVQSGPVVEAVPVSVPPVETASLPAVTLQVLHRGKVVPMDLEDYLVGVVRAEMPASFHPEALKAQAVAARTYTLYQVAGGGRHGDAHICTDPGCCQAYLTQEEAVARWGDRADELCRKTEQAVRDTAGEILLYGGEPILAAFHAASPARTRAAGEVWSRDLPYLQSVSSPETAEAVPGWRETVVFSGQDFRDRTGAKGWPSDPVTDEAGIVRSLTLDGETRSGTWVRDRLALRSACFTWSVEGDEIAFTTTGYGHGVGMSQYGADVMAAQGSGYRDILTHYYPGAVFGLTGEQ